MGGIYLGPQIVNLLALFTDPSLNAVTDPNEVSMFTEIIAESLENMAVAISLTWAREVIVFIVFWVELVVGLFPSDVKTLSDCRTDVNTIAYFVLLLP